MSDTIRLSISGNQAEKAASDLSEQCGIALQVQPQEARLAQETKTDSDLIGILTLIALIPSGILSAAHLYDRLPKRSKAKDMLEAAKAIKKKDGVSIYVEIDDKWRRIDDVTPDDLLDMATALEAKEHEK